MLVEVAHRIADEHLFPKAEAVDRSHLVRRDHFAPLTTAGLFSIAAPSDGADVDMATMRRVTAAIAGGCGVTFFCWAQHHGVVRTIATSSNDGLRSRLLGELCTGDLMAGVAFAHLRRTDRRSVTATRVDGGWRFDGFAPWATSWGVADLFAVAAETDDGRLVWGIIPGRERAGVTPEPLHLPVLSATGTVALRFDECVVADDDIAATVDLAEWRRADRHRAAIGQTGVLGVADRTIRLLAHAQRADDGPTVAAAASLAAELERRWADDDRLLDELSIDTSSERLIARASDHRAACIQLGLHATTALLAAVGGGGMDLGHPAQRLAREATFYVIQAQTADGRAATLRSLWS